MIHSQLSLQSDTFLNQVTELGQSGAWAVVPLPVAQELKSRLEPATLQQPSTEATPAQAPLQLYKLVTMANVTVSFTCFTFFKSYYKSVLVS